MRKLKFVLVIFALVPTSYTAPGPPAPARAVRVTCDPTKISYEKLLDLFRRNIDPLTSNAQFFDVGSQYRSAIFYHDAEQKRVADASIESSHRFSRPIVTQIVAASVFDRAEEYHQNDHEKNRVRYRFYKYNSARDQRLRELWGTAGR